MSKYGIADTIYYNCKEKYVGIKASDVEQLKELEDGNRCLKHIYTELKLDHNLLKDIIEKI